MLKDLARQLVREMLPPPLRERAEELRYFGYPRLLRLVRPHSLVSTLNLLFLQELAQRTERQKIPGDFVECGVYRGGSAGVLGHELLNSSFPRRLRLFDAFAGMPAASQGDDDYSRSIEGQFVGSEAQTWRILARLGVPRERVEMNVGWFEETLPKAAPAPIALLHVDCDFYEPVLQSLKAFYESVTPGGFVVLNDYGSFQGCRRATQQFFQERGETLRLSQIDHDAYYLQKSGGAEGKEF